MRRYARPSAWALTVGTSLLLTSGEGRAEDLSEISVRNASYCALYSRVEVLRDAMHGTGLTADTDVVLARAKGHYGDCLAVLPTLLPVSDDLETWLADMRDVLVLRGAERVANIGTEPASVNPSEEAWREACRSEYRTWDEADGTVVRRGSPEPVRCPLKLIDGAWVVPE